MHALGFHYVLTPVLLNVLIILSVAILFNLPFPCRRYPAVWARKHHQPASPDAHEHAVEVFSRKALSAAARAMNPALSLSENNLETVCSLALCNDETAAMAPEDIRVGGYYCNGAFGPHWQVRLVVEIMDDGMTVGTTNATVIYKVVAGHMRRRMDTAGRAAFAEWARYEVRLNENSWQRVETTHCPVVTGNAA